MWGPGAEVRLLPRAAPGKQIEAVQAEKRMAADGRAYTYQEFTDFFGRRVGVRRWEQAPHESSCQSLAASSSQPVTGGSNINCCGTSRG